LGDRKVVGDKDRVLRDGEYLGEVSNTAAE